jgi:hypothetical protein
MDEQYVYIDSRRRNLSTYANSNEYTTFLVRPITSIYRVDLVSASVPITTAHTSDKTSTPYVFLDIEQFRSKYGIQSTVSNSTALTTPIIQNYFSQIFYGSLSNTFMTYSNLSSATGNTVYYSNIQTYKNYSEYEYKTSVSFQQPIESLDRLNIRWVDYNNKLVTFDPQNSPHSFLLRVYTRQKRLGEESIHSVYEDYRVVIFLFVLILVIFLKFV